jgi:hypothetical protein
MGLADQSRALCPEPRVDVSDDRRKVEMLAVSVLKHRAFRSGGSYAQQFHGERLAGGKPFR